MTLPDYGAAMEAIEKYAQAKRPGLARVLGAIIYDSLALFALCMVAGFIFIFALGHPPATQSQHLIFQGYIFVIVYLFFCWFWTHGGQTIGMRSWKIKLMPQQGKTINWPTASRRFFLATLLWLPLGLGYVWILINSRGLIWYEKLSRSFLVHLPDSTKQAKSDKKQASYTG